MEPLADQDGEDGGKRPSRKVSALISQFNSIHHNSEVPVKSSSFRLVSKGSKVECDLNDVSRSQSMCHKSSDVTTSTRKEVHVKRLMSVPGDQNDSLRPNEESKKISTEEKALSINSVEKSEVVPEISAKIGFVLNTKKEIENTIRTEASSVSRSRTVTAWSKLRNSLDNSFTENILSSVSENSQQENTIHAPPSGDHHWKNNKLVEMAKQASLDKTGDEVFINHVTLSNSQKKLGNAVTQSFRKQPVEIPSTIKTTPSLDSRIKEYVSKTSLAENINTSPTKSDGPLHVKHKFNNQQRADISSLSKPINGEDTAYNNNNVKNLSQTVLSQTKIQSNPDQSSAEIQRTETQSTSFFTKDAQKEIKSPTTAKQLVYLVNGHLRLPDFSSGSKSSNCISDNQTTPANQDNATISSKTNDGDQIDNRIKSASCVKSDKITPSKKVTDAQTKQSKNAFKDTVNPQKTEFDRVTSLKTVIEDKTKTKKTVIEDRVKSPKTVYNSTVKQTKYVFEDRVISPMCSAGSISKNEENISQTSTLGDHVVSLNNELISSPGDKLPSSLSVDPRQGQCLIHQTISMDGPLDQTSVGATDIIQSLSGETGQDTPQQSRVDCVRSSVSRLDTTNTRDRLHGQSEERHARMPSDNYSCFQDARCVAELTPLQDVHITRVEYCRAADNINTCLHQLKTELMSMHEQDLLLLKQLINISQTIQKLQRSRPLRVSKSLSFSSGLLHPQPLHLQKRSYSSSLVRQNSAPFSMEKRRQLFSLMKSSTEICSDGSLSSFDESEFDSQSEIDETSPSLTSSYPYLSPVTMRSRPMFQYHKTSQMSITVDVADDSDQTYEDILKRNVRLWKLSLQSQASVIPEMACLL